MLCVMMALQTQFNLSTSSNSSYQTLIEDILLAHGDSEMKSSNKLAYHQSFGFFTTFPMSSGSKHNVFMLGCFQTFTFRGT
jgi:hypothetical protein